MFACRRGRKDRAAQGSLILCNGAGDGGVHLQGKTLTGAVAMAELRVAGMSSVAQAAIRLRACAAGQTCRLTHEAHARTDHARPQEGCSPQETV